MSDNVLGIIPARFASTRFPGKPLVDIGGKTMIRRVYEATSKALSNVVVATDDKRIYNEVIAFDGKVVMTSPDHQSGTDRCAEALGIYSNTSGEHFEIVINIQGDEPFINPVQIETLLECFHDKTTQIATLVKKIDDNQTLFNPNTPKVVVGSQNQAIYFSRSPIPFLRGIEQAKWHSAHKFYKHIGLYAYRQESLKQLVKLSPSILEKAERLEQLRWIENGFSISVAYTEHENLSIDTPDDLSEILKKTALD
jgi:3-deoxy-manno-octulosonate cytidylyltransferase (CMP-KDO synthetase)